MLSSYSRSTDAGPVHAAGMCCPPCSLQDGGDLYRHLSQPYDPRPFSSHPASIDPRLLLLNQPPVLRFDANLPSCYPEASFDSSHSHVWPREPYFGQYLMPETVLSQPEKDTQPAAARLCSPDSESSSSGASSSCFEFAVSSQALDPGPSGTSGQLVLTPSAAGPVRRGRGRPRKDAPPVFQPPPLCTYVDPLTGTPCAKHLNRHHDLPRHMFKHCQDEAALVISGKLPRELAILLPADWSHTDEMKLPCRYCGASFSRADAVTRHEKREHKRRPRKG